MARADKCYFHKGNYPHFYFKNLYTYCIINLKEKKNINKIPLKIWIFIHTIIDNSFSFFSCFETLKNIYAIYRKSLIFFVLCILTFGSTSILFSVVTINLKIIHSSLKFYKITSSSPPYISCICCIQKG